MKIAFVKRLDAMEGDRSEFVKQKIAEMNARLKVCGEKNVLEGDVPIQLCPCSMRVVVKRGWNH